MSKINLEKLITPISDDLPCGEDLSDLTEFYVLSDLVKGKEETQFSESEPPEWPKAFEMAEKLLEQGKELWVVVYLIHALVSIDGVNGLFEGLELLNEMLRKFWNEIYPELDDDDDNPAMERMNILNYLSSPGGQFVESIRGLPLTKSKQVGIFSYRDVMLANGEISPKKDQEVPAANLIEAAVKDTDNEYLAGLEFALSKSIDLINSLETYLNEQLGVSNNTSNLLSLGDLLQKIVKQIETDTSLESIAESTETEGEKISDEAREEKPKAAVLGISTREDVIKLFDKICSWYYKNEPSSPVPQFIERARSLVGKTFREIIVDVANVAENQILNLFGPAGKYDTHIQRSASLNPQSENQSEGLSADGAGQSESSISNGEESELVSQNDVLKALDNINSWFKKNESSSPIPIFVDRAKKLIGKDFNDIIEEIANQGSDQINDLMGTKKKK